MTTGFVKVTEKPANRRPPTANRRLRCPVKAEWKKMSAEEGEERKRKAA